MKGQLNMEFLMAAFIYISALGSIFFVGSGGIPQVDPGVDERSLSLKAEKTSTNILTTAGRYDTGSDSGTNWEDNPDATTEFGLATEFLELERDKVMSLETVGTGDFNYSQFREVTDADSQYRFRFSWRPVIETFGTFQRCNAPDSIWEPGDCDGNPDTAYEKSGNTIHNGKITLNGTRYHFLVTSRDGRYNGTYVTTEKTDVDEDGDLEWDFRTREPVGEGEEFSRSSDVFSVEEIDVKGYSVVLNQHLKTFGASRDEDSRTVKLERYASMENEPIKVEVWAW